LINIGSTSGTHTIHRGKWFGYGANSRKTSTARRSSCGELMRMVKRLKERRRRGRVAEGGARCDWRIGEGVGLGVEVAEEGRFAGASPVFVGERGEGSKKRLFASRSIGSMGEEGEASGDEEGLRLLKRRRRCRSVVAIGD
jgi:hypothetical protein